jgi:hypothetical protein
VLDALEHMLSNGLDALEHMLSRGVRARGQWPSPLQLPSPSRSPSPLQWSMRSSICILLDALDHFRAVLDETKTMGQLILINIGVISGLTPMPFDFGTGGCKQLAEGCSSRQGC